MYLKDSRDKLFTELEVLICNYLREVKEKENRLHYLVNEIEFSAGIKEAKISNTLEEMNLERDELIQIYTDIMIQETYKLNETIIKAINSGYEEDDKVNILGNLLINKYMYFFENEFDYPSDHAFGKYIGASMTLDTMLNILNEEYQVALTLLNNVTLARVDRKNFFLIQSLREETGILFNTIRKLYDMGCSFHRYPDEFEKELLENQFRAICTEVKKDRLDFFIAIFPWAKDILDEETNKLISNSTSSLIKDTLGEDLDSFLKKL